MSNVSDKVLYLERKVEALTKAREEDRETFLNLIDKLNKVIEQTNDREDQHFDDMQKLSDRVNLVEGMVDIFKKEITEIRGELLGIAVEEDMKTDETS